MNEYEQRVTKMTLVRKDSPIFDSSATGIEIVDEAAGEFLVVQQTHESAGGKIQIEPADWPAMRAVIDKMIKLCRK